MAFLLHIILYIVYCIVGTVVTSILNGAEIVKYAIKRTVDIKML
jgi:hypothetical protein